MAKYALLVGMNSVNASAYDGWDGKIGCAGSELDVHNIQHLLANKAGYHEKNILQLTTSNATTEKFLNALSSAANTCEPGDSFVIYYTGQHDESLLCYDGELSCNKLITALAQFKSNVQVVLLTDSQNATADTREKQQPLQLSLAVKAN